MLILIQKGLKIMWGKMKILVTSLFSFHHNVLKSYIVMVVYIQDCMGRVKISDSPLTCTESQLLNFHKLLLDGVTCSKRDFTLLFSMSSSFVLSLLANNLTLTADESFSSQVYPS